MATPIKMPDLGATVEEINLIAWRVQVGDTVAVGDILADIETDKAVTELESTADGVVLKMVVEEGEVARTGDVVLFVGAPGETIAEEASAEPVVSPAQPVQAHPERPTSPAQPVLAVAGDRHPGRIAPVVRNLAARLNVGLATVQGTGEKGVITREDVQRAAEARASAPCEHQTNYEASFLLQLYRTMVTIRHFEERVKYLFLEGIMPGTIHQYQGQEAVATGVCAALRADDVITSTHRPHGHAIAKGLSVESMMHELFGKATGCCRGKGGSMHLGDLDRGMVPAIAIVGGGIPVATGIGLAFRMRREPRVAVCFMGDGATNEGTFHEAINMGAIWSLPVVYLIENNLYGASTPIHQVARVAHLADRACAYGIPGATVDGNDVLAVYEAAREAVERARAGDGPTLLEAVTYRITGHSRRDPCLYQPEEERRQALAREPIGRFAAWLMAEGIADQARLDAICTDVDAQIEAAVRSAMAGPDPLPEDALDGVFA